MTQEKTSLFKMTPKSLTDEQTKEIFSKFLETAKNLEIDKIPNVEYSINKEKTRVSYRYKQQSRMPEYEPQFFIEVVTSCQGLEKVQLVSAHLNNCGLCHGAGAADITQRKFKQIESVLNNAFSLFRDTCEEYRVKDLKELKFDSVVDTVRKASRYKKTVIRKDGYNNTQHTVGKFSGTVGYSRDSQTFGFDISGLTPQQATKIGEVIASL